MGKSRAAERVDCGLGRVCASPSGSISIRLTDLYSKPLEGVAVTLRNRATGAIQRMVAAKGGVYRFVSLEPGDYTLEAVSVRLGHGELDDIAVSACHESHIQAAVELRPVAPQRTLIVAAGPAEMPPGTQQATALSPPAQIDLAPAIRTTSDETSGVPDQSPAAAGRPVPSAPAALPIANTPAEPAEIAGVTEARVPAFAVPVGIFHSARFSSALGGACVARVAVRIGTATLQAALLSARPGIDMAPDEFGAAFATVLSAVQLQSLPLAGRDWQSGEAEAPGEEAEGSSAARNRAGPVLVDGANTRLAFGNPSSNHSRGPGASLTGIATNESRCASWKRASRDGFRSATTERGGSRLHGHESVFSRQNLLAARNPFTQWVQQTAPATATTIPVFTPTAYSPSDREMIWSASLGGPLLRCKIAWFVAGNSSERNAPAVSTVKHPDNFFAQPSNDQMQVLSARLGLTSANPIGAGLAAYSGMLQTLDNLLGPASRTSNQWSGFGRLDWAAGGRQRLVVQMRSRTPEAVCRAHPRTQWNWRSR